MRGPLPTTLCFITKLSTKLFNKNFLESLDIFAQFFIKPLLNQNLIDKELKAVVSEFDNDIRSDTWREYQLLRHIANEDSPLNKFSNGNYDTLKKDDIYDILKKFHFENYSANIMNLVIYQNKPIDSIIDKVNSIFNKIPNFKIPSINYDNLRFPYEENNTRILIKKKSIKKEKQLKFYWYFNSYFKNYESQPLDIITHLIAHESEGSIHSVLYEQNLIYDLVSSYFINEYYYTEFHIALNLTEKGTKNIKLIVRIVSQYFNMLKEKDIPKWVFDEIKSVKKFKYEFSDKENILDRAINICENSVLYPIKYVNKVDFLMKEYQPELYKEIILKFSIDRLILMYCDNRLEKLSLTEPLHGTNYSVEKLPEDLVSAFLFPGSEFAQKLHLPPKNYFVSENFEMAKIDQVEITKYPVNILQSLEGKLFFKTDDKFNLPKFQIFYKFYPSKFQSKNINHILCTALWLDILKIKLKEFLYLADSAKIGFNATTKARGFEIEIDGFIDKAEIFLLELSKKIKSFISDNNEEDLEKIFNDSKKKALIDLEDCQKRKIYKRVMSAQYNILLTNYFTIDERINVLNLITFSDYKIFHKNFLTHFYYETLYMGNLEKKQVLKLNESFLQNLKKEDFKVLSHSEIIQNFPVNLRKNTKHIFIKKMTDKKEKNDCILIAFQSKPGIKEYYKMLILETYFETPFFEELRTEKQLGYSVISEFEMIQDQQYLNFIIQTNVTNSMICAKHIYDFILKHFELIKQIDDKTFQKLKKSVVKTFLQPFNNLHEESSFFWYSLTNRTYEFDEREKIVDLVDQITKQDLIDLYHEICLANNQILEIHFVSQQNYDENMIIFEKRKKEENTDFFELSHENILYEELQLLPDIYFINPN